MCKRIVYIVMIVLGIELASVNGELVHYWKLDDTETIAVDSAGGLNGIIRGGPTPIEGKVGAALIFDGTDDVIEISNFTPPPQGTVAFWVNSPLTMTTTIQRVLGVGGNYETWISDTGDIANEFFDNGSYGVFVEGVLRPNEWTHVAQTYDSETTAMEIYINGVLAIASEAQTPSIPSGRTLLIGHRPGAANNQLFEGILDDVRIYDEVLSAVQIKPIYGIDPIATDPSPEDGAIDVPREATLNWNPGEVAGTHDVYLGISFDDVNDADRNNSLDALASQGQTATTYDPPDRLDFGQTYLWRIDEVNAPPDSTIFKGDVWSFTVEPFAYPIENVTATASSVNRSEEGPENTINASGLDGDDLHSFESTAMWLSSGVDPNPTWIQYEFDRVYKLHQMWVWNYNTSVEPLVGFGIRQATIEYSTDGVNWSTLGATHEFAQGPGAPSYAPNTTVDLGGVAAKFVKITANSNWGGIMNQYGLSEVRILYIPIWAREPSPDSGATEVRVDAILNFRAGREAARHDVYLSTNEQAVIDGTVPIATVTEPSYASSFDLASTYYWRIDEANDAETPTTWQGDIWNLSTQEYLVVDDFESYNDIPAGQEGSNLIYGTWADGFENPANGSTIGYNEPFQPTMETSLVYDGRQSVPLLYDNTVATYSEVTAKVADLGVDLDWTRHGIKTLVLYFYGSLANSGGQAYVKINGTKVPYDGDVANLSRPIWTLWSVDLTSIGADLKNVSKLTIGIEGAGAAGTIYVDEIGLYALPTEPTEQIWIEAESPTTITAPLEIASTMPGASGGQYVVSMDSGLSRSGGPGDDGTGLATYTFTVRGGTYSIRAREIIPNDQADSWWIRIQGATLSTNIHSSGWIQWNGQPVGQDWAWNDMYSSNAGGRTVLFTMPAGTYTLEIAYREDGCLLDALVITAD